MSDIDIVERLRFDAARCEATFSKGVASNIEAGIAEIERLRAALQGIVENAWEDDREPSHSVPSKHIENAWIALRGR